MYNETYQDDGIKDPSLANLYKFVFKTNIQNAHDSKYDVINLHKVVKKLYDSNQLNFDEKKTYTPAKACACEESLDVDFSKLKLSELYQFCKDNKIVGYSKLRKSELIDKLNNNI